jgi:hypothetical protein
MFALIHWVPKLRDVVVAADELRMWYSQLPIVIEHQVARIRQCRDTIAKRLGIERRLQATSRIQEPAYLYSLWITQSKMPQCSSRRPGSGPDIQDERILMRPVASDDAV